MKYGHCYKHGDVRCAGCDVELEQSNTARLAEAKRRFAEMPAGELREMLGEVLGSLDRSEQGAESKHSVARVDAAGAAFMAHVARGGPLLTPRAMYERAHALTLDGDTDNGAGVWDKQPAHVREGWERLFEEVTRGEREVNETSRDLLLRVRDEHQRLREEGWLHGNVDPIHAEIDAFLDREQGKRAGALTPETAAYAAEELAFPPDGLAPDDRRRVARVASALMGAHEQGRKGEREAHALLERVITEVARTLSPELRADIDRSLDRARGRSST